MMHKGSLYKMKTEFQNAQTPVLYYLRLGEAILPLNEMIGSEIHLNFTGKIHCISCQRPLKKTFNQGYCYPCFQSLAETDICMVKPELCHHHLGTCRDNEFAQKHCFIPHVVYLAISSGVKVGITRAHQKMTRWMDQGAVFATEIAQVPHRYAAGLLETEIAQGISDKTNWRKMLQNVEIDEISKLKIEEIKSKYSEYKSSLPTNHSHSFSYPVQDYPSKITSYNLDKDPQIKDFLMGIKGQYLIFKKGVINLRKYQGYEIEFYP